jgi:hypothetical protein
MGRVARDAQDSAVELYDGRASPRLAWLSLGWSAADSGEQYFFFSNHRHIARSEFEFSISCPARVVFIIIF